MPNPRISRKNLALHRNGQLAVSSFQPLPTINRMNTKPIKSSGTIFVTGKQTSAFFPGRAPRQSPTKKLPKRDVPAAEGDFTPVEYHIPGAGSRKRAAQYDNWMKMLPDLVPPYLQLMVDTDSLKRVGDIHPGRATCACIKRRLQITVIRWISIEDIELQSCPHCDAFRAPILLLQGGLFPCSPCNPTLAVEIPLLQFFIELGLNVAPNNTAFCKTLENVLAEWGYKMASGERLRIRFGNTTQWFTQLRLLVDKRVNDALEPARTAARNRYADDTVDHPNEEAVITPHQEGVITPHQEDVITPDADQGQNRTGTGTRLPVASSAKAAGKKRRREQDQDMAPPS
ncbi:CxC2 domain-containing protein [Mycena indigotica]|uniref:CxC2 domain-containing protein n=1 Tax=Mycena indigotica TaxID=2126181 RepID=A0A8H6T4H6_9AGAR|nr:CxC2 domain-containing protein [Mycena indigotica]KAF7310222.1 CxC2 domain-containing protein [Mycena indigotica]